MHWSNITSIVCVLKSIKSYNFPKPNIFLYLDVIKRYSQFINSLLTI